MSAMIELQDARKSFTMHLQGGVRLPVVAGVQDLDNALRRCATQSDQAQRLACFDAIVTTLPQVEADRFGMTADIAHKRDPSAPQRRGQPARQPRRMNRRAVRRIRPALDGCGARHRPGDRRLIRSMHVRVLYPNRHDCAARPRSIALMHPTEPPNFPNGP